MAQETDQGRRARAIQQGLNQCLAEIRGDKQLTEQGRREKIAFEVTRARDDLTRLQAAENDELQQRRGNLVNRLFGLPDGADSGSVIAYRDAADRAAQATTPAAALTLLRRAEQMRDQQLAAAVARHAAEMDDTDTMQRGWSRVVGAWVDARPHVQGTVAELADIDSYLGDTRARMFRYSSGAPAEMSKLSTGDQNRVAAQARAAR